MVSAFSSTSSRLSWVLQRDRSCWLPGFASKAQPLGVSGCLPQTPAVSQHSWGSSVTLPAICRPHDHPLLVPLAGQASVASLLLFIHTKLEGSEKAFVTSALGATGPRGTWGPSPQSAQMWTESPPLLALWGCAATTQSTRSRTSTGTPAPAHEGCLTVTQGDVSPSPLQTSWKR